MKKWKKILIIVGCSILSLLLIVCILFVCLWHNEISTISSLEMIVDKNEENKSAPVYEMEVKGDYYFDKFLKNGGASSDGELIQFVVDNITKGLIPINMSSPEIGCASFTCCDENGNRYFGRNYDFTTTTSIIVKTNPGNGRYASISSCDLQFIGITNGKYVNSLVEKLTCLAATYAPLDGINEKGLSCGIYMSYQGDDEDRVVSTNQNTSKPDLTSTTMLRMILDYASTVEEAISLVNMYDLHDSAGTSFHYMVADSTGKSAILEWVAGDCKTDIDGSKRELKVHYNDNDSYLGQREGLNDFQYVTNFIVTDNYYDSNSSKGGFDRYNAIENMINPSDNYKGEISSSKALDVLKMVGRRNWDKLNGKSDSNGITVWSCLYDLTNKSVIWISNEEFENEDSIFIFDFSYLK